MKPLGIKNYGSIPHLPNSRLGPSDKQANPGHVKIATMLSAHNPRRRDMIYITEKLDGANCGVWRDGDSLVALTRSGLLAATSTFLTHRLFSRWVRVNYARLLSALRPGERFVGEWMPIAHGTRYKWEGDPFVVFDLMIGHDRATFWEIQNRAKSAGLPVPKFLHYGPLPTEKALELLGEHGHHGALDLAEGVVYRVELDAEFDFAVKFVRQEKKDGQYLSGVSGLPAVWNVDRESFFLSLGIEGAVRMGTWED